MVGLVNDANIFNPVTGDQQDTCPASEGAAAAGEVWVTYSNNVFGINGRNADDSGNVYDNSLTARK